MDCYEDHIRSVADAVRENMRVENELARAESRASDSRRVLHERQRELKEFNAQNIADELGEVT